MSEVPHRLVSVGVARVEADGHCVYVNERFAKILGFTREQLLGRRWRQVTPDAGSRMPALWDELRSDRPTVSVESYERPDGRRVSVQLESLPELGADGRVLSIVLTCVDVTDQEGVAAEREHHRERAAARLRELESVFANSPVGLALVDRDLRYVRVNQAIADMNGLPIDQIVGKTYRDLSPETADVAERLLRGIAERGESVRNLEVRARPPSDPEREHVFLLSLDPMRNPGGEITGLLSAVQDISELRSAEEAAARRLAELELVYASAPVGLCHVDTELRILHVNPLFAQLCDRSIEELPGEPLGDRLPASLARHLVPQLRHVARTGMASIGLEVRGRPPGPAVRDYTWMASGHPSRRAGQVTGVIVVLQDVTALTDRWTEVETARNRLAEAQHVARLGSWDWNILDDEVWWSRELYEIFGEPPTYVPSYTGFFEHVHPADRKRVRGQLDDAVRNARPYQLTYRILRGDGSERELFTVARLERTPEGAPARLVGTCQDISEFGPRQRRRPRRHPPGRPLPASSR